MKINILNLTLICIYVFYFEDYYYKKLYVKNNKYINNKIIQASQTHPLLFHQNILALFF